MENSPPLMFTESLSPDTHQVNVSEASKGGPGYLLEAGAR